MDARDQALLDLGRTLLEGSYSFTTVTPLTHGRVLSRATKTWGPPTLRPTPRPTLRDVFGWSASFVERDLPPHIFALLIKAEALQQTGGLFRSRVRFSTLGDMIFLHSAYPTQSADSVFFGPDTYRFVRSVRAALALRGLSRIGRCVDIGCGSGAGGLALAHMCEDTVLCDINEAALRYTLINAALNGIAARVLYSDVLSEIRQPADLIIANPPYLVDAERRLYRHGGDARGCDLSLRILRESLVHLAPGGSLMLYTGAPVVDGVDQFLRLVGSLLDDENLDARYEEVDPDVFGEELDREVYGDVERIAAVFLTVSRR